MRITIELEQFRWSPGNLTIRNNSLCKHSVISKNISYLCIEGLLVNDSVDKL